MDSLQQTATKLLHMAGEIQSMQTGVFDADIITQLRKISYQLTVVSCTIQVSIDKTIDAILQEIETNDIIGQSEEEI